MEFLGRQQALTWGLWYWSRVRIHLIPNCSPMSPTDLCWLLFLGVGFALTRIAVEMCRFYFNLLFGLRELRSDDCEL